MLDEADGTKNYGKCDRCSRFAFSFAAFCAAQVNVITADNQVLKLNVEFTRLAHHSRLFCG